MAARRLKTGFLIAALLMMCEVGRTSDITTLAGTGEPGTKYSPALEAQLNNPFGVLRGPGGDPLKCGLPKAPRNLR